jgi:hypothetical protein
MQNTTFGIYVITEKATGKMYVGLSGARDGIEGRWVKHKKLFPQDLFTYEILLPCPPGTTRAELSILEKFYIKELDCMVPCGFNLTSGGTRGTEVSEETRKKQSAAQKGIPKSEEHKAKLKGRVAANKGKPMSEEQKAKISAANKDHVAPNKGKPMSEEEKAKRSATQKGRVKGPMSEEERAKRSAALKARAALKRAAEAAATAALEALLFTETETICPQSENSPSLSRAPEY